MDSIILNMIMIVFPMLVYFVYNCYVNIKNEKYNNFVFDLVVITSIYLCFKYGGSYSLLFCNIPIMISYFKKRVDIGVVSSVFCLVYIFLEFKLGITVFFIKFLIYLGIYFISNKCRVGINKYMRISMVVIGFFTSYEYFRYIKDSYIEGILFLVFFMFLVYVVFMLVMRLFILSDNIMALYPKIDELEKEMELKKSLFKITHEVKNPIAVCKGYLEMFDVDDRDEAIRFISIIRSEIDRSLDIMSDFMEFGKIKINKDIMDVNMLIEEVEGEFEMYIRDKKINLNCKYIDDEVFVNGDYNRLKQVFVNLLKNSVESIDGDGCIDIITHTLKGYYYIEINDSGNGMSKRELEKVKEMFFTTKANGSGLGVSLANEIVKLHNGKLDYYSKEGIGTRVVVRLPILVL